MIAALLLFTLFLAGDAVAAERKVPPPGECPQPRFTDKAPPEYLTRTNPLTVDADTLAAAERLYMGKSGRSLARCVTAAIDEYAPTR